MRRVLVHTARHHHQSPLGRSQELFANEVGERRSGLRVRQRSSCRMPQCALAFARGLNDDYFP